MEFPQYRKLSGFNRFYKITDDRNFYEFYVLNGKQVIHHVEANQFPEMLRIKDMLEYDLGYEDVSYDETILIERQFSLYIPG